MFVVEHQVFLLVMEVYSLSCVNDIIYFIAHQFVNPKFVYILIMFCVVYIVTPERLLYFDHFVMIGSQ